MTNWKRLSQALFQIFNLESPHKKVMGYVSLNSSVAQAGHSKYYVFSSQVDIFYWLYRILVLRSPDSLFRVSMQHNFVHEIPLKMQTCERSIAMLKNDTKVYFISSFILGQRKAVSPFHEYWRKETFAFCFHDCVIPGAGRVLTEAGR